MQQIKKIELGELETTCHAFVENCNLLREKQDELEATLNEINKNYNYYKAGKVAKQAYEYNHQKFSMEADREKRDISQNVNAGLRILESIEKQVKSQELREVAPEKKPAQHHRKAHKKKPHAHHVKHHAKRHKSHHPKAHHSRHSKARHHKAHHSHHKSKRR